MHIAKRMHANNYSQLNFPYEICRATVSYGVYEKANNELQPRIDAGFASTVIRQTVASAFSTAHSIRQPLQLVTYQAKPISTSETLEREDSEGRSLLAGCRRRRRRPMSCAHRRRRRRRPWLRTDRGRLWRLCGGRLAGVFLVGGGVVGDQRHRGRFGCAG